MPSKRPIRILSDLHLAHPGSLVKDVRQLEPLLEEASKVVFNGDTAELRLEWVKGKAEGALGELREFCRAGGVEPVFINGNHDPDISEHHHVELMGGRMLVTHGHGLFPSIAPWGRDAKRLGAAYRRALEEICGGARPGMEELLRAANRACLLVPGCAGAVAGNRMRWLACIGSEMAHPRRPFEIFRAWATVPGLATRFAAEHRPEVECFAIGHTHWPGYWRRAGKLVINTGAYFPWLGRRLIDVWDDEVSIRKVEWDGAAFRPGKEIHRWSMGASTLAIGEAGTVSQ